VYQETLAFQPGNKTALERSTYLEQRIRRLGLVEAAMSANSPTCQRRRRQIYGSAHSAHNLWPKKRKTEENNWEGTRAERPEPPARPAPACGAIQ